MMDNDKWVWEDPEEVSPLGAPLLDAKLTPIMDWVESERDAVPPAESVPPPAEPVANPEPSPVETAADAPPPAPVPAPAPAAEAPRAAGSGIPLSVMRAIVYHL